MHIEKEWFSKISKLKLTFREFELVFIFVKLL